MNCKCPDFKKTKTKEEVEAGTLCRGEGDRASGRPTCEAKGEKEQLVLMSGAKTPAGKATGQEKTASPKPQQEKAFRAAGTGQRL